MTAEQLSAKRLEELLGKVTEWPPVSGHENTYDATLIALVPSLARRVIELEKRLSAAEKLVEALSMARVWLDYEGRYDLLGIDNALAAYREASK